MTLTLTQDDFIALGRQLADAAIASFQRALLDHAATVDLAAPTAHPLVETIVRQHGGRYTIAPTPLSTAPRDFGAEIDALKAALVAKAVITEADVTAAAAAPAAPPAPAPSATIPASAGT